MTGIPKCKDGLARLPITIEPNTPGPGSYTVHFGGEAGSFNAAHIIDLPLQPIHMHNLAVANEFLGICREDGSLYVESTLARDAAADLRPSSHVVNLSKIFKDIETGTNQVEPTSIVETSSVVPGELEVEGMALHKKENHREAQEAFDKARLNHELHTAAGLYFWGLNTLELLGLDLFDMGEHKLAPGEPVDPTTFRRIVMLWGAVTAFSQSERQAVGLDDPFIHLARQEKLAALNRLDRLGQIVDPELQKSIHIADSRLKTETLELQYRHPEQIRRDIAVLKRRLKREPKNKEYLRQLAWVYSEAGRIDEAIKLALRAIALSADDPYESYRVLVDIYREAGDKYRRDRIKVLEKLAALPGSERQLRPEWRELAELYMLEGKFEKAIDAAKNAVSRARQKVDASKQRLKDSGHEQRKFATNYYTKAKAELADTLNFLANIYMALYEKNTPQWNEARDQLHKAVEAYHGALEAELNNFDSMLGLAKAWSGLNNYKEALWAIQEAVKLKDDDPNMVALLYEINYSQKNFQQAVEGIKKAFRQLSARLFIKYGQKKLKSDGDKDMPERAELLLRPEQLFRDATELDPENVEAWQGLGITLYDISAQHTDEPSYKRKGLEAVTKALDLLSEKPDLELKALGILSENTHVELLVALVTLASERNQWETATQYLMHDKSLYAIARVTKHPLHLITADKNRIKFKRELDAIDNLLALGVTNPQIERRGNALKLALLSGLKTKADTNGPEGSNGVGTPGAPSDTSSTPEPANGPTNTSESPEQGAAPGWSTTVSVGGFAEDLPQSRTTSSTSRTSAAIRYRRGKAQATRGGAIEIMVGSGATTFGVRVPTWMTNVMRTLVPMH